MKLYRLATLLAGVLLSVAATAAPPSNVLLSMDGETMSPFQWLNPPPQARFEEGSLTVVASPETDFFIDPENGNSSASAPLLWRPVEGDFVASALVEPDFSDTWHAVALMVLIDDQNWIKFAFENSDATGPSIVSVVTRGVSDDANGVVLKDTQQVWLKLIRKGDVYAMHWSLDGENYRMTRVAKMPAAASVKVGVEAQSPLQGGATHRIHHLSIEAKTVENVRTGL